MPLLASSPQSINIQAPVTVMGNLARIKLVVVDLEAGFVQVDYRIGSQDSSGAITWLGEKTLRRQVKDMAGKYPAVYGGLQKGLYAEIQLDNVLTGGQVV